MLWLCSYPDGLGLMASGDIDIKEMFSHELSQYSASMLKVNVTMRTNTKSKLKQAIQVKHPATARKLPPPDAEVIDDGALLCSILWPVDVEVQKFIDILILYIVGKL